MADGRWQMVGGCHPLMGYNFGAKNYKRMRLVLYIPFLLIFDSVWGYTGLIYAQPAEEFVCMIISLSIMFFYLGRRMDSH